MIPPSPMSLLAELEESKGRPANYKHVAPNGAGGISKLQLQQFPNQLHNLGSRRLGVRSVCLHSLGDYGCLGDRCASVLTVL